MFQKIAYFAAVSGLPLNLDYRRGSYGPFSGELKAMTTRLVNHGLIEERRQGNMFEVKVGPAFMDAANFWRNELPEWRHITRRVADLFMRVDTREAEIMATVHMAASDVLRREQRRPEFQEVVQEVMQWKQKRRPPLDENAVRKSTAALAMLGWIDVEASGELPAADPELE